MKLALYWLLCVSLLTSQLYANCFDTLNRFRIRKAVTSDILVENDARFMIRLNKIEESGSY